MNSNIDITTKATTKTQTEKSINNIFWLRHNINHEQALKYKKLFNISDIISQLLDIRTKNEQEAYNFLYPKVKDLIINPFTLLDMEKGVNRLITAMNKNEKICIFGDYDTDGATSSALIKNTLKKLGKESIIYIPDRLTEGYGPSIHAMDKIKQQNINLVITVDCGSVAFEALEHATNIGLEVIVIDHHISTNQMPKAVAVINPNRIDEDINNNCKELAAVGVSFLFLYGLLIKLKQQDYFLQNNLQMPNLIHQLDLVALGTICDVMKLQGLNRYFVQEGLKQATKRQNIGLKMMTDISEIDSALSAYHFGFVIGPQINAGGRIGKSYLGASLLSCEDENEAHKFALELYKYNKERQAIEQAILAEATKQAEKQLNQNFIFIYSDKWHIGVIGIIASRLKDKYHKLAIVGHLNKETNIITASCRSIKNINIGNYIANCNLQNITIKGGGHVAAGGLSIHQSKIEELKNYLSKATNQDITNNDHLINYYDQELPLSAINMDLLNNMQILEPFGNGNHTPIFKIPNLYIVRKQLLKDKHLKLILANDKEASYNKSHSISAIIFNAMNNMIGETILHKHLSNFSVIANIKINNYLNTSSIQLNIKDIIL